METRKYFDVQWGTPKMPEKVRKYFFEQYEKCNDVWLEYEVGMSIENLAEFDILDKWLMDTFDVDDGEQIFLSHWW